MKRCRRKVGVNGSSHVTFQVEMQFPPSERRCCIEILHTSRVDSLLTDWKGWMNQERRDTKKKPGHATVIALLCLRMVLVLCNGYSQPHLEFVHCFTSLFPLSLSLFSRMMTSVLHSKQKKVQSTTEACAGEPVVPTDGKRDWNETREAPDGTRENKRPHVVNVSHSKGRRG